MASAASFQALNCSHISNPISRHRHGKAVSSERHCNSWMFNRSTTLHHLGASARSALDILPSLDRHTAISSPLPELRKPGKVSKLSNSVVALQTVRSSAVEGASVVEESVSNSSKRVLVVGATGGVGQLVMAALMDRGIKVRAILRNLDKACILFGEHNMNKIEVVVGDTRSTEKLNPSDFEGVTHVICCTGTTAFPSKRWDGDNTPENTDWHGVRNLIDVLPRTLRRLVLVSSVGVTKYNELPWNIMNLFGVLKYKKMGEDYLRKSGIPYTIIRPGRLTDGPYTSYDLNTLLKATAGTRRAVIIGQGDKLVGEASRIVVAEACIQALDIDCTCGKTYEINSIEGDGPGKDTKSWEDLFVKAHTDSTL